MLKDLAERYSIAEKKNDANAKCTLFAEAIDEAKVLILKTLGEVPECFSPAIASAMINIALDIAEENGISLRWLLEFTALANSVDAEILAQAVRIGNKTR